MLSKYGNFLIENISFVTKVLFLVILLLLSQEPGLTPVAEAVNRAVNSDSVEKNTTSETAVNTSKGTFIVGF